MNMIQQGAASFEETSQEGEIGSYNWQMSGSFNPSLPKLSPFISSISFSSISTMLTFKTITDAHQTNVYSPNRLFYAPDRYTIYNISGSISGTPVTIGGAKPASSKTSDPAKTPEDPFNGIGDPISPWTTDDSKQEKITQADILIPPVLSQTFSLPSAGNTRFSIDYSISPSSSSELQFMSKNWETYEDVNWNESQSILAHFAGNTNLNFRIDHSSGLFSNIINLSGSGTWREFSYLNEEMYTDSTGVVNEEEMEKKRREQYSQTNYSSSYSYTGTIKPFYSDPVFAQTNFQYTFKGTLVKSKRYDELSTGNGPELTPEWGSWVKEQRKDGVDILGLNIHKLTGNLTARVMDKNQSISFSADLPPRDGLITANAAFRVWITDTSFNYKMEKPETEEEWKVKTFDIKEIITFKNVGTFTHTMAFNPEDDYKINNLRSALSLALLGNNFNADYSMIWASKSVFKLTSAGGKWEKEGDPELLPKDLKFSYNRTFPNTKLINNNLNLSYNVSTSLNFDLQEHTNSNFQFSMGFNLGITDFLELKISATSQNAVIFRYFKGVSGMEELTSMYTEGEQNNLFIDLFDSFNFFDESKRRRSGFKMQRFNLEINHLLGDWTASIKISMYPYQKPSQAGAVPSINIISDISLLVQWKPITEIKSDINFDGKNDRWTVK
jgi:hypothetical protein